MVPVVKNRRVNALADSSTSHEISLTGSISQAPLYLEIFQIPFDFWARSNPVSRPAHLPFLRWGCNVSCISGFSISVFSCFHLAQKLYLPPREWLCIISYCSDHVEHCPKGQERMRTLLPRNENQPLRVALHCILLGRESTEQINSTLKFLIAPTKSLAFAERATKICDVWCF